MSKTYLTLMLWIGEIKIPFKNNINKGDEKAFSFFYFLLVTYLKKRNNN
jgi:hypothetical protein